MITGIPIDNLISVERGYSSFFWSEFGYLSPSVPHPPADDRSGSWYCDEYTGTANAA